MYTILAITTSVSILIAFNYIAFCKITPNCKIDIDWEIFLTNASIRRSLHREGRAATALTITAYFFAIQTIAGFVSLLLAVVWPVVLGVGTIYFIIYKIIK